MHSRVLLELPSFGKNMCRMDLLSVRTNVGFAASHRICANSKNSIQIAKSSFEYTVIFSCAGEKIFEPNDTGAYSFRFHCIFWSGFSSIMRAYPALLKSASVIKTSCIPGMGYFKANSQAPLRVLMTESNLSFNSDVMLIGTSLLSTL